MASFDENDFRRRVDGALEQIRKVLETERKPTYPADVPHTYDDKYLLAEHLTNSVVTGTLNVLEVLGLSADALSKIIDWAKKHSVTLRFRSEETCTFLRKEKRKVEDASSSELTVETKHGVGKVKGKIFRKFEVQYSLFAYRGTDIEHPVLLQGRSCQTELKTSADNAPRPKAVIRDPIEVSLTWFATQLSAKSINFRINREDNACRTPRRNPQVESALSQYRQIFNFGQQLTSYFENNLFTAQSTPLDLKALNTTGLFVPVLALFEHTEPPISANFLPPLLAEQKRSITEKLDELKVAFKKPFGLISIAEASFVTLFKHLRDVSTSYIQAIDYIESMLYKQLVAAIGKEVQPVDFTNFMNFWSRKLFKPEYQPRPFSYAVRRPDHTPEGVVTIEAQLTDGSLAQPLPTLVASEQAKYSMNFTLDAATLVPFLGQRYLHTAILSQFSGVSSASYRLVARARQFSIYALLVGKLTGPTTFEPQGAILIQNKDDLKIPLMLEQIPSPTEFKDAIESMSPEQQRFCKMYRSMQLSSSMFGVVVLQIKPQLEKLLNLPVDSLTKEIRLTQKLLELLQTYQIPSDLLSYDGDPNAEAPVKVALVAQYVNKMFDVIAATKEKELKQAQEAAAFRSAIDQPPPVSELVSNIKRFLFNTDGFGAGGGGPGGGGGGGAIGSAAPLGGMAAPVPTPPPAAPVEAPVDAPKPEGDAAKPVSTDDVPPGCIDYTAIPAQLDEKFAQLDPDHALHAVIVSAGNSWQKSSRKFLLSEPADSTLGLDEQRTERNKAFDLIDALSKSGALGFEDAELHIMTASNHCFDKALIDTIVQNNVNPIEKVERSLLIVASTIHNQRVEALLKPDQVDRVREFNPQLFQ